MEVHTYVTNNQRCLLRTAASRKMLVNYNGLLYLLFRLIIIIIIIIITITDLTLSQSFNLTSANYRMYLNFRTHLYWDHGV